MAEIIPFPRFHRAQMRSLLAAGQARPGRQVWGPTQAGSEHGKPVSRAQGHGQRPRVGPGLPEGEPNGEP